LVESDNELVLYADSFFKTPLKLQDFGDVEAGDMKTKVAYLSNETSNEIEDIDYEVQDPDVRIDLLPNRLSPGVWKTCKIIYSPHIDRITPLEVSLSINGVEKVSIRREFA